MSPPPPPNPVPAISSVTPSSVTAGASATTVTVNGSGFIQSSTVQWNQSSRATTFISSTELQITLTATDLAIAGTAQVAVVNTAPGGGTSSPAAFTINNPTPQVSGISPSTVTTAGGGSTMTVTGSGFVSTSSVTWNGTARATTYVSAAQLQFTLQASDVAAGGSAQVSVSNPAPGGGAASPTQITIVYPLPIINSLNPPAVAAGGPALTLTINGTGFAPTSVVQYNGVARATSYVNSTTVPLENLEISERMGVIFPS